jgi:hypothetical protein
MTETASGSKVDAFTAEVIRNSVVAITNEMKTNLMRTAYNMIIYEAEDFTVGLFDADGRSWWWRRVLESSGARSRKGARRRARRLCFTRSGAAGLWSGYSSKQPIFPD